uniref:Flavodoxin-like domain-containing protein n=2 Tax=Rhodosorus marinus TaxID=101924 RepID=A0A7S3A400_9RHOD|mmetsp:Transcript_41811/g.163985  ORF Transcript_41811/g.163985 Transcript_41811/m.163985 type:complete len:269 (+) Transcript_41811:831-1637(+)|eukprot:CAMPEP_0113964980 /NCGR_PEP_ID=MMETSP0011_2-20120614/7481_1 /TAXON_ID=101924 /ORGANISM="Rhodosorus marinus" /LENGTH=268 /DNA_ID=CAMNT_0000977423 /DNA_START=592 /DNA_END=1398 /DNA_ORIENTATION=- /assembly_acc=CAM_ASM_000156
MSEVEEVISEESGSEEDSDWEEWADDEDEVVVEEEVDLEDALSLAGGTKLASAQDQGNFWERPRGVKKIIIIYYSLFGNLGIMADEIKRGIQSQGDCEAFIYQVEEIYPREFLEKINATSSYTYSHPVLTRTEIRHFPEADGFVFGVSSRMGSVPAPMKAFFESTGGLWLKGAMIGKAAGVFTSSPCQGAGSEATALSLITLFAHHGMMFVPLPAAGHSRDRHQIESMSPFGSNCITGIDGIKTPSTMERKIAMRQGRHFAQTVNRMV